MFPFFVWEQDRHLIHNKVRHIVWPWTTNRVSRLDSNSRLDLDNTDTTTDNKLNPQTGLQIIGAEIPFRELDSLFTLSCSIFVPRSILVKQWPICVLTKLTETESCAVTRISIIRLLLVSLPTIHPPHLLIEERKQKAKIKYKIHWRWGGISLFCLA